jgi:hypothetical protein
MLNFVDSSEYYISILEGGSPIRCRITSSYRDTVAHEGGLLPMRVDMPSLDTCVVTPRSDADWGVIRSRNHDVIPKALQGWGFALENWKAAFQRYLVAGQSKACSS